MQNLKELLERAKKDENAFREIYDFTVDRVFDFVILRLQNKEETKEVLQEIYLSFWKSLPNFEYISDEHFYGFLWKVVRRQIYKKRLKKIKTVPLEEIYDIPEEEREKEDYRFLLNNLKNLKEKERLVVELRYFANLSFEEVSKALDISLSNAKVLHHRAIKKLKISLKKYYV